MYLTPSSRWTSVVSLLAVAVGAIALVSTGAAAANTERVSTSMYLGSRNVGAIYTESPGLWRFDCIGGYAGGYITRGPRRHLDQINVHYMDGSVAGYSRLRNGRVVIYMRGDGQKVKGIAVRRSSTRWDVERGKRVIGHTKGRDGPEAATVLATMCPS
jgi:hypothetical protein